MRGCVAVIAGLTLAAVATAQPPAPRFHWQPGQVLTYRVEQTTSAAETLGGKQTETSSKLTHVKRWEVLDVDAAGVATLRLSLTALRIETTTPGGEVLRFDSADPQGSNAQMREQLGKFVGQPLAVLRVNGLGQVVEVKESKFDPASRFESEPPFVVTLPAEASARAWDRAYQVTLEPPHGTGEKFAAVQHYAAQPAPDGSLTLALTTELKSPPEAPADQIPLLQTQPQGEATFDLRHGRLDKAELKIDKELKGHQGEGSSYRFRSVYTERWVGEKN